MNAVTVCLLVAKAVGKDDGFSGVKKYVGDGCMERPPYSR